MSLSIEIFETGKLVRFKENWLKENKQDPDNGIEDSVE